LSPVYHGGVNPKRYLRFPRLLITKTKRHRETRLKVCSPERETWSVGKTRKLIRIPKRGRKIWAGGGKNGDDRKFSLFGGSRGGCNPEKRPLGNAPKIHRREEVLKQGKGRVLRGTIRPPAHLRIFLPRKIYDQGRLEGLACQSRNREKNIG